jgi:two-component system response regulator LytT
MTGPGLRVLAVDDEPPALDELAYLLRADGRVGEVRTASDSVGALQQLEDGTFDAVFLDIRMPGLSGLDLARVLARFAEPPAIVFVTAHEGAAVDAFALRAVDYLLKPLRRERLSDALARLAATTARPDEPAEGDTIAVELGGVTRFVAVADVRFVEAQGDYARLHTADGSHLVRIPMTLLEQRWAGFGFVRVHRSFLVAASHITELRVEPGGGHVVRVGTGSLAVSIPVSRRHTRELKDRLVRRARDAGRSQP